MFGAYCSPHALLAADIFGQYFGADLHNTEIFGQNQFRISSLYVQTLPSEYRVSKLFQPNLKQKALCLPLTPLLHWRHTYVCAQSCGLRSVLRPG